MSKLRTWTTKGTVHLQRIPAIVGAIDTCVEYVHEWGAATFMELADAVDCSVNVHGEETMTVGTHPVGNGVTMTPMSNPCNVVLWNGAAAEFLAVIEGMLAREPRVVLERTSCENHCICGTVLRTHYNDEDGDEEDGPRLPVIDFGDPIAADGYAEPHWLPVMFAWAGRD
jgi:hypothetical protein